MIKQGIKFNWREKPNLHNGHLSLRNIIERTELFKRNGKTRVLSPSRIASQFNRLSKDICLNIASLSFRTTAVHSREPVKYQIAVCVYLYELTHPIYVLRDRGEFANYANRSSKQLYNGRKLVEYLLSFGQISGIAKLPITGEHNCSLTTR